MNNVEFENIMNSVKGSNEHLLLLAVNNNYYNIILPILDSGNIRPEFFKIALLRSISTGYFRCFDIILVFMVLRGINPDQEIVKAIVDIKNYEFSNCILRLFLKQN